MVTSRLRRMLIANDKRRHAASRWVLKQERFYCFIAHILMAYLGNAAYITWRATLYVIGQSAERATVVIKHVTADVTSRT